MKKQLIAMVIGVMFFAANAVFAQSGLQDIEAFVREQKAKLATVQLEMLHFDITEAAGRTVRAFQAYRVLEKKIQKLSENNQTLCAQLPTMPYRQTLREAETSAARVVDLMDKITPLITAGGTPSEGMQKLMDSDLPRLMQTIAANSADLQALFSELETICSKEG